MNIPVEIQTAFLKWQIKEHENYFLNYLKRAMNFHFKGKTAFIGKIFGFDEKRGNLILRFPKGLSPRLKVSYLGIVYSGITGSEDFSKWEFSYEYFREKYAKGNTDILPIYFLRNDDTEHNYVGCRGLDVSFVSKIREIVDQGKRPSIVLAEGDPPIQYLLNLINYIDTYPTDKILNVSIDRTLADWYPDALNSGQAYISVLKSLNYNNELIIQGPPGTGKSHLIAEVTSEYLKAGKSVCITSLTNKALMEVAEKPGIKDWVDKKVVFKTNLTFDEKAQLKNMQLAESLSLGSGQLLLATYYKLSDWYKKQNSDAQKSINPVYDLIIVEEASQCFLATIAAFRKLGSKVIFVGDPMQLSPIVLNENIASSIHARIMNFAKGFETYASNASITSYLLTESFRLSTAASIKTGLFYKDKLTSVQQDFMSVSSSEKFKSLVVSDRSSKLAFIPLISDGNMPLSAIDFIVELILDILANNPGIEIAVLAPFRATVLALQEKLGERIEDFSALTVETIDRIQGLTVDFTVFLLALNNPSFAMNINRFNVATSRAKSGTLIITDQEYVRFMGIHPLVTKYLASLEVIYLR